jgi:multidrug efflux pump
MHSLWFFFLRKQEFSWLVMLVLVAMGIYTLLAIPKEASPEVIVPVGIVTTVYSGASARDIEELITNRLEDAIENVDDIKEITSTSRDGVSSITAEFNASANVDDSIQALKDAIDAAKPELPRDAEDPIVSEVNFANQPIFVISISSDATPSDFTALSETIVDEFKDVLGVSKVDVSGVRPRQVQVVIEPEKLTAFGLTLSSVTGALAESNSGFPVGAITAGGVEYSVRLEGKLLTADDVARVIVATKSGTPVYLSDVATVVETVDEATSLARVSVGGQPSELAMTLSIFKKSGVNVTTMSDAVNEKLAVMQKDGGLLANSQVLVIFDQGEDTKEQLSELVKAGTETVILVMISLLLTIGWRESVVAGLSIPLSFVIAFIGLYASGNTINFLSLFALILAVGILVDSGIVVTEAIHTRLKRTGSPLTAARETIREYAWPLIAGTMTTVAVFAPLFFLSGVVGQFIASIPFTIIFVLIASIFVALGMVPLIAILLTSKNEPSKSEKLQEAYTEQAQHWYRAKLVAFFQNFRAQRWFLWSLFLGFVLALMLPMPFVGLLKVQFFPPEDVDFIYLDIEAKEGTPLAETNKGVRQVEELLYEVPEIESFSSAVGGGSAFTGGGGSGARYGNITVALHDDRDRTSADISRDLRAKLAAIKDVKVAITEQQNGPPSGAPISFTFTGEDMSALAKASEEASLLLEAQTGVRDVTSSADSSSAEFVLRIDNAKANLLGVNPASVGPVLRAAVFGLTATTLRRDGDDIDVVVRLGNPDEILSWSANPEITLDALRNIEVKSMTGETVLLGSLLTSDYASANSAINHKAKERIVTVNAFTEGDITATEVVTNITSDIQAIAKNNNVALSLGGEAEDINQSFTEMFLALIAGLLLMLAILVLSFNSVRYSFYLLLAVPYSLIGVFIGLAATGLALSFTSLLGVIALAGVIINHAIILMDSLITAKASHGETGSLIDQVADASVSRLRPIFLTTITTVVGMIPLSRISDFWSPLAFAIMFGLSFAMILTLILIPTLYYRNELRIREGRRGIFARFCVWLVGLVVRFYRWL